VAPTMSDGPVHYAESFALDGGSHPPEDRKLQRAPSRQPTQLLKVRAAPLRSPPRGPNRSAAGDLVLNRCSCVDSQPLTTRTHRREERGSGRCARFGVLSPSLWQCLWSSNPARGLAQRTRRRRVQAGDQPCDKPVVVASRPSRIHRTVSWTTRSPTPQPATGG
jgi:hypothetical protein